MVRQANLNSELESVLGPDAVLPPERAADFAVDGLVPRAAVAPDSVEQVAAVMRYAHAQGLAVIPRGGGTRMHLGNVPRRYDVAVSLSRLDRVVEHEPADLIVTCQAGSRLAALQRHLAEAGQFLPLDPPGQEATIGGVLATNASGRARYAYGTARDLTIGLRVVTADGRVTKAGGRVVKNVAGYDLCKLYIGSLGTLGVIVEATFKVAPLPKAERALALAFDSAADACAFAADLHRRGLSVRALALLNVAAASTVGVQQDARYALLLELAGTLQAVERSQHELGGLAPAPDAQIDTEMLSRAVGRLAGPHGESLLCKLSVLPTQLPGLIDAVEATGDAPAVLALPTAGVAYASWPSPDDGEGTVARLRGLAAEMGGTAVVEACPIELKQRIDVFGDPPPSFDLMRRIKEQFDPTGVLSPGRFLGRL